MSILTTEMTLGLKRLYTVDIVLTGVACVGAMLAPLLCSAANHVIRGLEVMSAYHGDL